MQFFTKTYVFLVFIIVQTVFSENGNFLDLINEYSPLYSKDPLFFHTKRSYIYYTNLRHKLEKLDLENLWYNYIDDYYYVITILTPNELYYCKGNLIKACTELKNMNERLQRICRDPKTACGYAYNKMMLRIKKTVKELLDESISEHDKCNKLQIRCFLLEYHKPAYLNEGCKKLKEYCYKKVRMEVAKVILHDLLRGTSGNFDKCLKRLKTECLSLNQRSPELLDLCINGANVCLEFISNSKKECQNLQNRFLLKQKIISEKNCLHWLEICYYIIPDCSVLHHGCHSFRMNCAESGFFYDAPQNYNLDLFENPSTYMTENGVRYAYEKLHGLGIYVTELKNLPEILVLELLVGKITTGRDDCVKALIKKCPLVGYLEFTNSICNIKFQSGIHYACINLNHKVEVYCESFLHKLKNGIRFWNYPYLPLSEAECLEYLSACYFVDDYFIYWKGYNICKDIRLVCYQIGLETAADKVLMKRLSGKLRLKKDYSGSLIIDQALYDCKKVLFKECAQLMYHSYYVLYKCLHLQETCRNLTNILYKNSKSLDETLKNLIIDPDHDACRKQKQKCRELEPYFEYTLYLCKHLDQSCKNIDRLIELRLKMLKENASNLLNKTTCINYLNEYCIQGNREYACVNKITACKHMLDYVSKQCQQLSRHLLYYEFSGKQIAHIEHSSCSYLTHSCKMLKGNCPNSLNTICFEVEKICTNISAENKNFNDLIKLFNKKTFTYDICKSELIKKCENYTTKQTMNILCTNINNMCERLGKHLEKVCDQLVLKVLRFLFIHPNSTIECQNLTSLCTYIGSSCTGINSRVTSLCHNSTDKCKLLESLSKSEPSLPSLPTEPKPSSPIPPKAPLPKPELPSPSSSLPLPPPSTESKPSSPQSPEQPLSKPKLPSPSSSLPVLKPTDSPAANSSIIQSSVTLVTNSSTISLSAANSSTAFISTTSTSAISTSTASNSTVHSSAASSSSTTYSSITRSSTITRSLRPIPTISPGIDINDFGIKAEGLRKIKLIWTIFRIMLCFWIII
ncbi:hypothetical protein PMAC_002130 [Pneumocystis sp. 'macacae']|nr:hypothetical protein PMAC_002130 [Pneumocystis sp. 'macacae']